MSITLRFKRDSERLGVHTDDETFGDDPCAAQGWELEIFLLHQQVDWAIAGVTLIDSESIPLLYLTNYCLDELRRLQREGELELTIPTAPVKYSRVEFRLFTDGENAVIQPIPGKTSVTLPYTELLSAWETFAAHAHEYILSQFPGLRTHPEIGSWFDE